MVAFLAMVAIAALLPGSASALTFTAGCSGGVGDTASLVAAINAANMTAGTDTVDLGQGCTYTLGAVDNFWFGQNGLPAISSSMTIEGQGATIARDPGGPSLPALLRRGRPRQSEYRQLRFARRGGR